MGKGLTSDTLELLLATAEEDNDDSNLLQMSRDLKSDEDDSKSSVSEAFELVEDKYDNNNEESEMSVLKSVFLIMS